VIYTAKFRGSYRGAIGITYLISTVVEGNNQETARLALYDRFEHISGLTLDVQNDDPT